MIHMSKDDQEGRQWVDNFEPCTACNTSASLCSDSGYDSYHQPGVCCSDCEHPPRENHMSKNNQERSDGLKLPPAIEEKLRRYKEVADLARRYNLIYMAAVVDEEIRRILRNWAEGGRVSDYGPCKACGAEADECWNTNTTNALTDRPTRPLVCCDECNHPRQEVVE